MKLVLFDCDGTLVDSVRLIHEVMARTFVDFGYKRPDVASTKSIIERWRSCDQNVGEHSHACIDTIPIVNAV